jgi:predicted transcriptional regulator
MRIVLLKKERSMSILSIEIPDELLERLHALAREHSTSLNELVLDVLAEYVEDDEAWDNDPSPEEIKRMVEEAIKDYESGNYLTFDEMKAELERDDEES